MGRAALATAGRTGLIVALLLPAAAGCARSDRDAGTPPATDAAVVVEWARTDLGFGRAADCMAPYLVGIDLEQATGDDLRAHGLDGVPPASRQRISDALVVCGIREAGR